MLNRIAAALILGVALPSACTAQVREPRTAGCPAERIRADLGIDGIQCDGCTIRSRRDPDGPPITFSEPPVIDGVVRGGVADGAIRPGDVLLAIDGVSIVGRAGGYAFDAIRPNVPVRLTLGRDGQRRDVTLVPGVRCHQPHRDEDDDDDDGDRDEDEDPR